MAQVPSGRSPRTVSEAIEQHRAAIMARLVTISASGGVTPGAPTYSALDQRSREAYRLERAAWQHVQGSTPRTVLELAAMAQHVDHVVHLFDSETDAELETAEAFKALVDAIYAVAGLEGA